MDPCVFRIRPGLEFLFPGPVGLAFLVPCAAPEIGRE